MVLAVGFSFLFLVLFSTQHHQHFLLHLTYTSLWSCHGKVTLGANTALEFDIPSPSKSFWEYLVFQLNMSGNWSLVSHE
jgi:hypothetical protein